LHILVGYDAHPAGIQMVFWLAVVVALLIGMRWSKRISPPRPSRTPVGTTHSTA